MICPAGKVRSACNIVDAAQVVDMLMLTAMEIATLAP